MAPPIDDDPAVARRRGAGAAAPALRAFGARMDRLRLRHLRLLDLIAREGSLSAAADALGVSQPGATKMLQEIEAAFGGVLIERTAKGGRLTAAGRNMLDRLRVALQALDAARSALDVQPEMPLVRLGMLPLVGLHALSHVVGALQHDGGLPRIQIRLDTVEGLLTALSEGRVDCAVGFLEGMPQPGASRRFHVTPLWEEALVIVAGKDHPLARRRQVTLEQARDEDWVLMPQGSANRRAVEERFQGAGLAPPAARIETESFHIALALASATRLLTAVPESAYRQYQAGVRVLPISRGFPTPSLGFITLADAPPLPAVARLSQWFQHYAQTGGRPVPAAPASSRARKAARSA